MTSRQLTHIQRLLLEQCRAWAPVPELQFHQTRRWRIDVALPGPRIAVEIQGGVWTRGKHGRGSGIVKDMEKAAALAAAGWRLITCTPEHVENGTALAWIRAAIQGEGR